jgi:hypothetical protein
MIKNSITRVQEVFHQLFFSRKKDGDEALKESFGNLKNDSFNHIKSYLRNKDHNAVYQVLEDKTCDDVDFDEFFMFLDHTHSKIGQQYL